MLMKVSGRTLLAVAAVAAAALGMRAWADEPTPVFEMDCVNFAGRFLANAPVKKKVFRGLAVDGTAWSLSDDGKHLTITRIFPGEAAEKEGLEAGDEILTVNGYPFTDSMSPRDIFFAYHMYEPDSLSETLSVRKKGGSEKSVKLQLIPIDSANAEEKTAWMEKYKAWGY